MSSLRRIVTLAGCAALALGAACVADRQNRRPPRPPSDVRARTITIASHDLLDDDNNGYPDIIPLILYFWDLPARYPLPIWDEGVLRLELRDEQQHLIAEWEVPPEVLVASRRRDQVGAVHVLTLDIREATTDVLPPTKGLLTAQLLATDGHVAQTGRPLAIKLGG